MSGVSQVLQHIRCVLEAPGDSARGDRELLEQFAGTRDEAAFAALVRRHGRLVLGVCRRVLGDAHEAEDAFQATFLVLARKAGSIRKQRSLGTWLYSVAYRLAQRTRGRVARQRQRETAAATLPIRTADDLTWKEVRSVLDEELSVLPDRLRAPLILCYFEGKTQDEAARHLNWSLATVRRALDRGRERLRTRLTRRGLELSAALAAALMAQDALAALPTQLLIQTVQAAAAFAAGGLSSPSALLAEELMKALVVRKLKTAAALLLAVGLAALGVGWLTHASLAGPVPVAAAADEPVEEPPSPRRLLAVCPGNYLYANAIHYGDKGLQPAFRHLAGVLGVPDSQATLLSDRAANPVAPTRTIVERTIAEFLESCREQDRVALYFAGHVAELDGTAYLVPLDGQIDKPATLIPLAWLYERLDKCKARQKAVILDASRFNPARGIERGSIAKAGAMLGAPPAGVELLSACSAGQYSLESDLPGGSVFLYQVGKLAVAGGLDAAAQQPDQPLPVAALADKLKAPVQKAAQNLFKLDQTVCLLGRQDKADLGFDAKMPKPGKIPLVVPQDQRGVAQRGDVLRMLAMAERVPPLFRADPSSRLTFEILPRFPKLRTDLYQDDEKETDLRTQVAEAIQLLNKHAGAFPCEFPPVPANPQQKTTFKNDIMKRQQELLLVCFELEGKLEELKTMVNDRLKEPPHWQASYDYTVAMLGYRIAFCFQYNATLGLIRKDELPLGFDAKLHKGLRIVPDPQISDRDALKLATNARKVLEQMLLDHRETPWEVVARRELAVNLGMFWVPY